MTNFIKLSLVFIAYSITSYAQETKFSSYNWNTFPAYTNIDTITSKKGSLIELERRIFEYYLNKDNLFEVIFVYHQKVKVTSNDALNKYNKIYISLKDVIEILNIKARFISSKGLVTELPNESIKKVENMDNSGNYSIFAIEGAEIGGEIEYFYTVRKEFASHYTYWAQSDEIKQNYETIIQYPSKLEFITKSYNNFPEFKTETDSNNITTARAFLDYIPALEEEVYSYHKANLMRYEISMSFNNYTSALRAYSWNKACANIYDEYYTFSSDDKKAVNKFLKEIKLENEPLENKIRLLENKVKNEIAISDEIKTDQPVNKILNLKQSNLRGTAKLFVALFTSANIPFELVSTSNKEENPFDPEFNSWNFLDQYIIYFPDINKSMIPDKIDYRLGIIPNEYVGQFGLFMHPLNLGPKLNTLAYDIKKLPNETYEMNTDSLFINLKVDPESQLVTREVRNVYTGHSAWYFQSFLQNLNKEKQLEFFNSIYRLGEKKTQIDHYTVQNEKQNDIGVRPFIINMDETSNALIESAGNDLIIKIGETIGPQTEMYQEKPRQQAIQIGGLHNYYRKIELKLPKGYKINKPDELNMNVELKYKGKVGCLFSSNYTLEGDKLIVISKEYYDEDYFPKAEYNAYRDVVNASANFNKCKVVLIKQ